MLPAPLCAAEVVAGQFNEILGALVEVPTLLIVIVENPELDSRAALVTVAVADGVAESFSTD